MTGEPAGPHLVSVVVPVYAGERTSAPWWRRSCR